MLNIMIPEIVGKLHLVRLMIMGAINLTRTFLIVQYSVHNVCRSGGGIACEKGHIE